MPFLFYPSLNLYLPYTCHPIFSSHLSLSHPFVFWTIPLFIPLTFNLPQPLTLLLHGIFTNHIMSVMRFVSIIDSFFSLCILCDCGSINVNAVVVSCWWCQHASDWSWSIRSNLDTLVHVLTSLAWGKLRTLVLLNSLASLGALVKEG